MNRSECAIVIDGFPERHQAMSERVRECSMTEEGRKEKVIHTLHILRITRDWLRLVLNPSIEDLSLVNPFRYLGIDLDFGYQGIGLFKTETLSRMTTLASLEELHRLAEVARRFMD
jgi:hypothetical protein